MNTPEKIRIGIIGTGWWTDSMYLPSLKSHHSAEIVAICGRNLARAELTGKKHDIPQVFTDYRSLIENGKLDAIVVATPDDLHFQMTMDALDAGLHVLCEKPLALNAEHAKAMYEKAEAAKVKHMVLFTWRWQPHFQYLKQLIDEGYIGQCQQAQFRFLGDVGVSPDYQWRFDGQRSNGVVADLGAHMIDFARLYIGDVSKVGAHLTTSIDRCGIDGRSNIPINDSALITLEFDNRAQAIIQVSAVAHQADRGSSIYVLLQGNAGSLEVEHKFFGEEAGVNIRGARRGETRFSNLLIPNSLCKKLDENNIFDSYIKQSAGPRLFLDSIIENRQVSPNFYDGFMVQKVIDAALESHRTSAWVALSSK